jgi:hypothetical protein
MHFYRVGAAIPKQIPCLDRIVRFQIELDRIVRSSSSGEAQANYPYNPKHTGSAPHKVDLLSWKRNQTSLASFHKGTVPL